MTAQERAVVSVLDPVEEAIGRVKLMLFEPFDLGKWFVVGFCAWLAYLGHGGGGGGGNFRVPKGHGPGESIEAVKDFVLANLFWIIPTVILVLTIAILIGLLIVWLSSRGRFMFLHCVALNRAEVKVPWAKYRREGNSLFLFRVVVGLIYFAAMIILIAFLVAFVVIPASRSSLSGISVALVLSIFLPVLLAVVISFLLIHKFTKDFVVPIMYLRTSSCVEAWREFLGILSVNKCRFLLYILFQIVIGLAIAVIVLAACCVTCCCACCILVIPYIGTVLFLPVLIFKRAYSLFYFRQYGAQFDVFVPEAAAV
jgi:hypothetical protein